MRRERSIILVWTVIIVVTMASILLGLWLKDRPERRYDAQVALAAKKYGLDPALIKAIIWQESRFNRYVRGRAGEIGLMQVREDAAFEWADAEKVSSFRHEHAFDPQTNILCGSFYFAKVLQRYQKTDNPVAYALADYNAGRTHVLRWTKGAAQTNSAAFFARMDFPSTRHYAQRIMDRRAYYKRDFAKKELALR
jgi:soluble lytic murein transglycosylase